MTPKWNEKNIHISQWGHGLQPDWSGLEINGNWKKLNILNKLEYLFDRQCKSTSHKLRDSSSMKSACQDVTLRNVKSLTSSKNLHTSPTQKQSLGNLKLLQLLLWSGKIKSFHHKHWMSFFSLSQNCWKRPNCNNHNNNDGRHRIPIYK